MVLRWRRIGSRLALERVLFVEEVTLVAFLDVARVLDEFSSIIFNVPLGSSTGTNRFLYEVLGVEIGEPSML